MIAVLQSIGERMIPVTQLNKKVTDNYLQLSMLRSY